MTTNLSELQKNFVDSLNNPSHPFLHDIHATKGLSSEQHLSIYKGSITGALQKVLTEIYSVCYKLVGEDFFIAMANEYIAVTPSLSPDLANYGHTFAEFIAEFPPANSLAYLPDIAKLEWAWHRLDSSLLNSPQLDFEKLSKAIKNEKDILFLLPNESQLLYSTFPIHRIWQINQSDYHNEETIVLQDDQQFFYFIWRNHLEKRIDMLSCEEWTFLTLIQQKMPLEDIAEIMTEQFGEINLVDMLLKAVNEKWLCDFHY